MPVPAGQTVHTANAVAAPKSEAEVKQTVSVRAYIGAGRALRRGWRALRSHASACALLRTALVAAWAFVLIPGIPAFLAPAIAKAGMPLAFDASLGYESFDLASGNANAVRPKSPSGLGVTLLAQSRFAKWVRLYAPYDFGLRVLSLGSERKTGDTLITTSLESVSASADFGLGVRVTREFSIETMVGGDFALWSRYHYRVNIPGYVPIDGNSSLSPFYRAAVTVRAVYKFHPEFSAAFEISNTVTGSYSWRNAGTKDWQTDDFDGYALRVVVRYFLNDPKPAPKRTGQGLKVVDGVRKKREGPAKSAQDLRAKSARPPASPPPQRVPATRQRSGLP